MFDFDDFFETTLNILLILFLILILILGIGATIYHKRDILNQDEQIKMLEQSLQEQIQEKEVYMKMLEEKGE